MAVKNSCERFVDELVELIGEGGLRSRFSAGITLLKTVYANMEMKAPARELDVDGFRPELIANNQRGELYRHLRFHAALTLLGPIGWLPGRGFHLLDWLQARRGRPESITEMADNRAGRVAGKLLLQGFRHRLTREALREALLKELAEAR